MGRPHLYRERRERTVVRLPATLKRRLAAAADERDVSANLLATKAIQDLLDRLDGVDEALRPSGARSAAGRRIGPAG